jgi:hypothetical protein
MLTAQFLTAASLKEFEKELHDLIKNAIIKVLKSGICFDGINYTLSIGANIENFSVCDGCSYDTQLGAMATYINTCQNQYIDIKTLSKPRIYVTFSVKLMNPRYSVKSYNLRFETEDYVFNNETNEIEFTKAPSFCLN